MFALANEAALASTVAVQLTRVMAGVAMARALGTRGVEQQAVAGLSVGAFAAAVVCGALQFADALQLVRLRGALMERAYPQGYGLAAIVGLDERSVSRLVEQVSTPEAPVYLANLNAPTQFVIAGAEAGLQAALGRARTRPTRPRHAGPRRHSGRPRPERDVCGPLARRDDGAFRAGCAVIHRNAAGTDLDRPRHRRLPRRTRGRGRRCATGDDRHLGGARAPPG
jgi:hypothetical protein